VLESTFSQYLGIDVTYTCAQDRSYTKATGYGCKSVLDRSQTVLKPTYSFLGTHRVTPGLSCALMHIHQFSQILDDTIYLQGRVST
jgi:hypothetical protein